MIPGHILHNLSHVLILIGKEMLINESSDFCIQSSYSCTVNCIGNSQAACINSGLSFMGFLMSVLCAILSSGSMSS